MAEVGITAIVVGAILFVLGFFPGLLRALIERFQGLLDHFFPSRGRTHKFQTDLPLHTDAWLLGGGGVILSLGLLALLC
jgi:hypothetical protein